MMTRLRVTLTERDARALSKLAYQEYRDIDQQAAAIIRDELQRRGLLPVGDQANTPAATPCPTSSGAAVQPHPQTQPT